MSRAHERGHLRADRARYGRWAWVQQPALWAIAVYRFGRWTRSAPLPLRPVVHAIYYTLYSVVRLATGIDIPRSVTIGPGLMIHHFGGIIINPQARLGAGCTLRQGVTIGTRVSDFDVPTVGDRVEFGAYAQVLGDVQIANDARIGALSVVMCDVGEGMTAVGIPARLIGNVGIHDE
ncbi:serine O-acetyltransferase [Microbacterium gallinarum]|uniref:Serine acetyltransferase n=1 Tax=Microbacterium gallinarum TaxID=2762209 RepID=A0ABR8X331_9MICO|nr:serine acetyltransferase [Microbacterium gallinarum]MBD8023740.1 serine acetyltransferase [Microbacterium gallinarum]